MAPALRDWASFHLRAAPVRTKPDGLSHEGSDPPSIRTPCVRLLLPVPNTLVIVESPTKARTICGFLPRTFREASMGHVRDLPNASEIPASHKARSGPRPASPPKGDLEPLYVVPKDKKKIVKELKDALKAADELLLATDEDREGESISWHLLQLLNPGSG